MSACAAAVFFFTVDLSNTSLQQGTYPGSKTQEIKLVFIRLIVPARRLDHHGELTSLTDVNPSGVTLSLRGHHRGLPATCLSCQ